MKLRFLVTAAALAFPVSVQAAENEDDQSGPADIIVTGTRLSDSVQTFPGSVSVVSEDEIQSQLATTRDIAQILSFSAPGVAPGNDTAANVGQSLRGRPMRIFIDGVPVSNPLRDGGRDVRLIAPTALGGIEVIRGSSALYGQGGAGGIVNYITKNGAASDQWKFRTEIGTSFSTEHFGDSMRPYIFQSASGGLGGVDINVNGSYERVNGQFDADGKRLPPDPNLFGGIADSDIYNFYGKVGYDFGGTQRIEAMANYYQQTQDTDYVVVPGNIAQGIPAGAVKQAQDPRALDQRNRNFVSYFAYTNSDILGSSLRSQIYYLKNYSVFGFEAARLGGTQTTIESQKYGLQTDFKTRLDGLGLGLDRGLILWGFDINRDITEQPLLPLTAIDGRAFAPPMRQTNFALFVQADLPLTDWFTLRAGIRHDEFRLKIDPFVAGLTGVAVEGGKLSYGATPVNIGATVELTEGVQIFGGFSQGFSVPDIGGPFRNAQFSSIDILKPKAAMVNNYEIGTRLNIGGVKASAAYFISTSKLGTDFVINPLALTEALIIREKERIHGFEATLDGKLGEATRWGLVFAWSEGKRDADGDGKVDTPLSGRRISPETLNGFIEHDITDRWNARLQVAYTGGRDKFPDGPVGTFYTGKVEPTTRIDASTSIKLGPTDITLGISNLLNNDYYTVTSQMLNRNERYSKALGRTILVQIGIDY
ncbi:TonB-dependent receptor [Novosphingobium mathurense]|uniref:Iron complex outermembrane recepter protein n=1 Tax=Novosphingobium mathurense TaxID=428990 RepID=A0A1U6IDB1_9SPHN|nr:TonB-dependent receptor [Novosphingobium mathurense]SLK05985.1 iron complex outermembrane recepter protein [Novosphingobium mathurense]HKY82796.1 TonB-dependent receptor [Sphingobium sp.]